MTDEEINRRVAEIEGWTFSEGYGYSHEWRFGGHPQQEPPDYATEWGWCGPLVPKHKIDIIWCSSGRPMALFGPSGARISRTDDTPQRAICLAVIAASPSADAGQSDLG